MSTSQTQVRSTSDEVYDLAGALHRIVMGGDDTNGAVAIAEVTLLPGAGVPLHTSSREDLAWHVIDGVLEVQTPHGTRSVAAGESVFFGRGDAHGVASAGRTEAKALMVAVPAGIEVFIKEASELVPDGVPAGPPPPEALAAFAEIAARHGISVQG